MAAVLTLELDNKTAEGWLKLINDSEKSEEALGELEKNLDAVAKAETGVTKEAKAAAKALKGMRDGTVGASEAAEKLADLQKRAADRAQEFGEKSSKAGIEAADKFRSAAEGAFTLARGIGFVSASSEEDFQKVIQKLAQIQGAFDVFKGGVDLVKNFSEGVTALRTATTAAAAAHAAASATQVAGNTAVAASNVGVTTSAGLATVAVRGLNAALIANPAAGWTIAVTAGVAAGIALLRLFSDEVETAAMGLGKAEIKQNRLNKAIMAQRDAIQQVHDFERNLAKDEELRAIGRIQGFDAIKNAIHEQQAALDAAAKKQIAAEQRLRRAAFADENEKIELGKQAEQANKVRERQVELMNALLERRLELQREQREAVEQLHDQQLAAEDAARIAGVTQAKNSRQAIKALQDVRSETERLKQVQRELIEEGKTTSKEAERAAANIQRLTQAEQQLASQAKQFHAQEQAEIKQTRELQKQAADERRAEKQKSVDDAKRQHDAEVDILKQRLLAEKQLRQGGPSTSAVKSAMSSFSQKDVINQIVKQRQAAGATRTVGKQTRSLSPREIRRQVMREVQRGQLSQKEVTTASGNLLKSATQQAVRQGKLSSATASALNQAADTLAETNRGVDANTQSIQQIESYIRGLEEAGKRRMAQRRGLGR